MARFIAYQSPQAILEPTLETINAFEQAIRWAEIEVPNNLRQYMERLVYMMALINQKEARKMSFGPQDSSGKDSAAAWKLPVRRITQNYYLGWKVRKVGPDAWQLYNDSREAYFIEFGINWLGEGRRVRRPIRKMSLRRTMEKMMATEAYHRVWIDIYANPRTRHRNSQGFSQIVQSPGGRWEDMTDREIGSMVSGYHRSGGAKLGYSIRRSSAGRVQRWRGNSGGGGTYGGPKLGRKLP